MPIVFRNYRSRVHLKNGARRVAASAASDDNISAERFAAETLIQMDDDFGGNVGITMSLAHHPPGKSPVR